MRIGIPREARFGETLVAATAKTADLLVKRGYDVVVESGAEQAAGLRDESYAEVGVRVGGAEEASDIVVKVSAPPPGEIFRMRRGATVVSLMAPARSPELLEQLKAAGVTGLTMDAVPRISVQAVAMATGNAGVQNPLSFEENRTMLFGDAKERVDDILRFLGPAPAGHRSPSGFHERTH